ncbi:MAG: hypothetical protein P1T08_17445 [Acidimicrobiia bacterium]|nr:hypothetical protein [Acidimicrobiia bacterium]
MDDTRTLQFARMVDEPFVSWMSLPPDLYIETDAGLERLGTASGPVTVPADACVLLCLGGSMPGTDPLAQLPPDAIDKVWAGSLSITDDDLRKLAGQTSLRELSIGFHHGRDLLMGHANPHEITDEGMRHLRAFKELELFEVRSHELTDAGLAHLTDAPLRHLRLTYGMVTGAGVASLDADLEHLTLEISRPPGGMKLDFADRFPSLRELGLRACGLVDDELAKLIHLPDLQVLDISANRPSRYQLMREDIQPTGGLITDIGLRHLSHLTALRQLDLGGLDFSDVGVGSLGPMERLESLGLSATDITDKGLRRLPKQPALTALELSSTKITDKGVARLSRKFPALKYLGLTNTTITDDAIEALNRLPALEEVVIYDTGVTIEGLSRLKDHPSLRLLNVFGMFEENDEWRRLEEALPGVEIEPGCW